MSIPTETTSAHVTSKLKEKINENSYSIGELIVPQVFQKMSLRNNKIEVEDVTVKGYKIIYNVIMVPFCICFSMSLCFYVHL